MVRHHLVRTKYTGKVVAKMITCPNKDMADKVRLQESKRRRKRKKAFGIFTEIIK